MTTKKLRLLLAAFVTLAGLVLAVPAAHAADGPADPEAAAEGGSGEGEAFLSEDGFMWHSDGAAGATYPGDGSSTWRYHPQGGTYTVVRNAIGRYTITFPSLGGASPIPTVTAYGSDARNCSIWFFSNTSTEVRCANVGGADADSRFTVRWTSTLEDATTWVSSDASTLIGARNPWGGAITATNPSTGTYRVTTPGGPNFEGGHIQVTAYQDGGIHCYSGGWSSTTATIYCKDAADNPINTAFTFLRIGSEDDAYAWADDDTDPGPYTTSTFWSHNPQGNNPTSERSDVGSYLVRFPGLLRSYGGQVSVTAYGNSSQDVECKVGNWTSASARVYCHDSSGARTDSLFDVLYTRFRLCDGFPANVEIGNNVPTSGNDVIIGTNNNDTIAALGGNDLICALAGDDNVIGAAGNDVIFGGPGNDTLSGNAGSDIVYGDDGNDTIFTGSGNDIVFGGNGDDELGTSSGFDRIQGGPGNDVISGGSDTDGPINGNEGNDAVNGGGGDDPEVFGGLGDDTVSGNGGDDKITGGPGQDEVRGGPGDDIVLGGDDNDFISGNAGIDICDGEGGVDVANVNNCETILNVP